MIPDFQTIMLPLLQIFKNDKEKTNTELRKEMVAHFKITEDEQRVKFLLESNLRTQIELHGHCRI